MHTFDIDIDFNCKYAELTVICFLNTISLVFFYIDVQKYKIRIYITM